MPHLVYTSLSIIHHLTNHRSSRTRPQVFKPWNETARVLSRVYTNEPFIAGSARVQRVLKCLHMSRSARFCTILWMTREYQIDFCVIR